MHIMNRAAHRVGVFGQDEVYPEQLLLKKVFRVVGSPCDADISTFPNLIKLSLREEVVTE